MFKKATKTNLKLRLALSGVSGAGKTYTGLAIASYLGSSVAVIDTEHGSASRYADRFNFDVCELTEFHPIKYIEAINEAARQGYEVILVDSLTHAWFAQLEIVGQAKNSFTAWGPINQIERKLINTIVGCPAHIICTMRSKTEWDTSQVNEKGKMLPKKIGTAPVQREGIQYEFDVFGEITQEHILHITKSRCFDLQDKSFANPGRDIAEILLTWLTDNWQEKAVNWAVNIGENGYTLEKTMALQLAQEAKDKADFTRRARAMFNEFAEAEKEKHKESAQN